MNLLVHAHSIDLVANVVVPLKFIMSSTFVYIKDMSLFLEFIMIMYVFGTGTIFLQKSKVQYCWIKQGCHLTIN